MADCSKEKTNAGASYRARLGILAQDGDVLSHVKHLRTACN